MILWEFSVDLDPCCDLDAGWISIQALSDNDPDCLFWWMGSHEGTGQCWRIDYSSGYEGFDAPDMAFCLTPGGGAIQDDFYVTFDQAGFLWGGGSGYPDGQGEWYEYPSGWVNIWFYDHPFSWDRYKEIHVSINVEPNTPGLPGWLTFAVNWSTPEWSEAGNPPGDPRVPPIPGTMPDPNEDFWIVREITLDTDQFLGPWEFDITIPDYNPEWVSIDVMGYNFDITGTITHECIAKPPTGKILDGPWDPYTPIDTPIGTWHEIWPDFCVDWECVDWVDNGNGVLDYCDYILLEDPDNPVPEWWHIEDVTVTLILEQAIGDPPDQQIYMDWIDWFPPDPTSPIGWWHEIYPNYCTQWECVDWDDNGDGIISYCDWLTFVGPDGAEVTLHVVEVNTDIYIEPGEPGNPPVKELDGPDWNPYVPVADPVGPWHELWPNYCVDWECVEWIDNNSGVLDYCDYMKLREAGSLETTWWHVENVTMTVLLNEDHGLPPFGIFDWTGLWPPDATFPYGYWHEIAPNYCTMWECVQWDDTGAIPGEVDPSDWLCFSTPDGGVVCLHVEEVATDITIVEEDPPCPWDTTGDGVVGPRRP